MSITIHDKVHDVDREYIPGMGRNPGEERQVSHLYVEITLPDPDDVRLTIDTYLPMCQRGWNRSNGASFSIFRGHVAARGVCKICQRRAEAGLPGVESKPGSHKTKWL